MVSFIFEYGASLFDSVLAVWFITKFTGKSFDPRNNKIWIPAIAVIFAYSVFSDNYLPGFSILSSAGYLVLHIVYGLLIAWNKKIRVIISAMTWKVGVMLFSAFLVSLGAMIAGENTIVWPGQENVLRYVTLILHKLLLITYCHIVLLIFKGTRDPHFKSSLLTVVFSLISIVGIIAATVISGRSADSAVQVAVFVIAGSFILGTVVLYIFLGQILKLQKEKIEFEFIDSMMRYEHKTYEQASKIWDDARKVRHDMKQHLELIRSHLEKKDPDGCLDYVKTLLPSVEKSPDAVIRSDNKVIDYVINSKLGVRDDIDLLISGSLGDISDIEEPDLVSILGNILDNAIEAIAETERRELELIFYTQNDDRFIICKNSITKSVLTENKMLASTKKNKKRHGLGTKIVKQEAEKYGGLVDYYEETSPTGSLMFCVQVMIPKKTD